MNTMPPHARNAFSRRSLLAGVGTVAAASLVSGCGDAGPLPIPAPSTGLSDADILNFALNLEYLEAEFYLRAATGAGLSSADAGGSSAGAVASISGQVPTTNNLQVYFINEIAQSELAHVRVLRQALGSAAIVRPALDLQTSFIALATAAGVPNASTFNPFSNFSNYMVAVSLFEDIGVTAYTGSAALLTSTTNLNTAAGIQAKEAYTAALARTYIAANASVSGSDQTALTAVNLIINQVNVLAKSDGSANGGAVSISSGVTNGALQSSAARVGGTLVPADSTSKAFGRTPNQVLHVAYGKTGAGVSSGGFFPSGLNGTVKTTSA